jgi:hypothetical protein
MSEEEVRFVIGESPETAAKRKCLEKRRRDLIKSLRGCEMLLVGTLS